MPPPLLTLVFLAILMAGAGLAAYYSAMREEEAAAKSAGLSLAEYQAKRVEVPEKDDSQAAEEQLLQLERQTGKEIILADEHSMRALKLHESKGLVPANFIANEVRSGGFTAKQLKEGGFSAAEVRGFGYSARDLKKGGFKASELRHAGASASELRSGGYSAKRLKNAKFSAKDLQRARFTAAEVLDAGYTPLECKVGGFSAADLIVGGCTPRELKEVFTLDDLKKAGCDPKELLDAGWNARDLRDAGFAWYDLMIWAELPLAELRKLGFTSPDEVLRCFEEHPTEMTAVGYSVRDLLDAGCELWQLGKSGSFSVTDIVEALPDVDAGMLRDAGFRAESFEKSGFTIGDLLKAGFEPIEVRDAGFSAKEIDAIVNPKVSLKGKAKGIRAGAAFKR